MALNVLCLFRGDGTAHRDLFPAHFRHIKLSIKQFEIKKNREVSIDVTWKHNKLFLVTKQVSHNVNQFFPYL